MWGTGVYGMFDPFGIDQIDSFRSYVVQLIVWWFNRWMTQATNIESLVDLIRTANILIHFWKSKQFYCCCCCKKVDCCIYLVSWKEFVHYVILKKAHNWADIVLKLKTRFNNDQKYIFSSSHVPKSENYCCLCSWNYLKVNIITNYSGFSFGFFKLNTKRLSSKLCTLL